jgi:hypothetical protein
MPKIDIPAITARTTSDGAGRVHGVVAGSAPGPEQALDELRARAQAQAARMAAELQATRGMVPGADLQWQFDIVDVRLASGPMESGQAGWTAYGTLTSKTATAW